MATESVNGPFDGGYIQEATPATQATTTQNATQSKAAPQEIGWYFVEQYYTTMSKTPERIHLFYAKKSQLVSGDEAEKVLPSVGQKAISEKIKELGIENCKVRVLNVDSQSSLNNIVVQVIGELSNKGNPSRKFVQTFVLAEQPNGYFVLNDIFRYLNEYVDEVEEEQPQPALEEPAAEDVPQAENNHEIVADEQAAQTVEEKLEEVIEHEGEAPVPTVNGIEEEIKEPEIEAEPTPEPVQEEEPATIAAEVPPEPEPTPAHSPPKAEAPAPVEAPPAKKTWANLVGSKAPSTPTPTPVPALPGQPKAQKAPQIAQIATSQAPVEPIPSPASSGSGWQTADHGKKQNRPQQRSGEQHLAYVKNVTSKVDEVLLRATLEKFGNLKYFDVSRQKNCAFVDFADAAGYQAAVAANPHTIGTEQVTVEERRPRPGAFGNQAYGRGGPNAGRGRGGMQGRQGSQGGFQRDVNRVGYQPRGGRGGNITPKGRSQVEAV